MMREAEHAQDHSMCIGEGSGLCPEGWAPVRISLATRSGRVLVEVRCQITRMDITDYVALQGAAEQVSFRLLIL